MGMNDQQPLLANMQMRRPMGGGGGAPGFGGVMDQNGGQGGPPSLGALDRLGQGGGAMQRPGQMVTDQGATGGAIPDALKLPYERGDNTSGGQGVNDMTPDMNVRPGTKPPMGGERPDAGVTNMGADPGGSPNGTQPAATGNGPQMAHDHLKRRAMMQRAMQQGMPASLAGLHSLGFGNFGQGGY